MTLTAALKSPALFSRHIIGIPLHHYQIDPITAVLDSVLHGHGREFLIIMPRQSGKNEAIAHLLVMLLNLYQRRGGNIVYGAIGDGLGRGISRLQSRLDNPLNGRTWRKAANPTRRIVGAAAAVFLSSHPQAFARGETAHILLVIDELQDQNAPHIEQVFEPMRAANNATAVYLGTVKFKHDALWQKKEELERLERTDGIRRVFFIPPDQVTAENEAYGRFLAAKIAKFGRNHPIVASEYYLEPIDGSGGLFDESRRALMMGTHGRQHTPDADQLTISLIDVGGQDEAATDPVAALSNPSRDYTTCTIVAVDTDQPLPVYRAIDIFTDQGGRHFQDNPGLPSLAKRLNAYLERWGVAHTIIDASGVGEGLADWLAARRPGQLTPFKFTATSKAQLGSSFVAAVETGRFQYMSDDAGHERSDGRWFWRQAAACVYEIPPDGRFDTHLRWFVPATHKTPTAAGNQLTHDDRLLSAALCVLADELIASGAIRTGRAVSAVIPPADPLNNLTF
ncbi:MAG: hypothetical protein ACE5FD_12690 [Anaerolineae bacterium]